MYYINKYIYSSGVARLTTSKIFQSQWFNACASWFWVGLVANFEILAPKYMRLQKNF